MKLDKSPQGYYDPDIVPLLKIINTKYQTTSSCSGRITLMNGTKKGSSSWVYKTHTPASAKDVYAIIQKEPRPLRFLYEPLILHLRCKTQTDAENVLRDLHAYGFKKSGMIAFRSWTIEINDTGKMETIVTRNLDRSYIHLLITEANKRLKKTKKNIQRLEQLFLEDL